MTRRFLLCFLTVVVVGGVYCFPRIIKYPYPSDPHRYHHHLGDGAGEADAVNSYYYWTRHGYLENGALPCLNADIASHCVGYTHYPPLPHLFTSWNLQLFGAAHDFVRALQWTRVVIFLVDSLMVALGLTFMTLAYSLKAGPAVLVSALVGFSKGFWLYADNLYGHGAAVAVLGVLLGIILTQHSEQPILTEKTALRLYAVFVFLCLWVDWEPAPAAWLLPGCLLLTKQDRERGSPVAWRFFKTAALFSIIALACRLVQNTYGLGGAASALKDWKDTAAARSMDIGAHNSGVFIQWNIHFLFHYLHRMAAGHFFMMRKTGAAAVLIFLSTRIYAKKWNEVWFWVYLYFVTTSWNWIMWQHSIIHFFTPRYAIWSAAIALTLLFREDSHDPS